MKYKNQLKEKPIKERPVRSWIIALIVIVGLIIITISVIIVCKYRSKDDPDKLALVDDESKENSNKYDVNEDSVDEVRVQGLGFVLQDGVSMFGKTPAQ